MESGVVQVAKTSLWKYRKSTNVFVEKGIIHLQEGLLSKPLSNRVP